jgi:cytochrome P450
VHIQDPEFYDELYLQRLDKDKWFITGFAGESTFATGSAELHRLRRSAMNPFFSKASISSRFPVVQQAVKRLCERLDDCIQTGQVILTKLPFIALTNDVISLFAFGKSYGTLEEPDFGAYWKEIFATGIRMPPAIRIFPPLRLMLLLPTWVAIRLNPVVASGIRVLVSYTSRIAYKDGLSSRLLQKSTEGQVVQLLKENERNPQSIPDHKAKDTIFEQILSAGLPPQELTVTRLSAESTILVGAGSETTANALDVLTFHLLDQPQILQKLRAELRSAHVSYNSTLPQLESLPYLVAIMKEGLRCANGITTRSIRVTREPLRYRDWVIPANTAVSMTIVDVLTDPSIFPDPDRFKPERWLGPDGKRLEKFLIPFNKGPRQCIGIELAKAEILACVAMVFSQFEMELVDTEYLRDIKTKRDHFIPKPGPDSKGIRVRILRKAE